MECGTSGGWTALPSRGSSAVRRTYTPGSTWRGRRESRQLPSPADRHSGSAQAGPAFTIRADGPRRTELPGRRRIIDLEKRRTTMRTTLALIGSIVAAGAGLALAAGLPQQRAGGQAPQPALRSSSDVRAARRSVAKTALLDRAEVKPIVDAIEAFTKVYGTADADGLERLLHRRRGSGGPSGNRNAREGRGRLDVRRVIPGNTRTETRVSRTGSAIPDSGCGQGRG